MKVFSLEQRSKARRNPDAFIILRQYKLNLLSRFTEIKSMNTKCTRKRKEKELGFNDSTKKRHKIDIKKISLHRSYVNRNGLRGPQKV